MAWRIGRWIATGILVVMVVGLLVFRPDRAAGIAAAGTAHFLCSGVFVAGLSPDMTYRELVQPQLGPFGSVIHYEIDPTNQTTAATTAPGKARRHGVRTGTAR